MNTNPKTKRILAFGDSNTWGRIPGDDNNARYSVNIRWTGILQELLGNNYEIIEEGLNGRTTNLDSPQKAGKNGKTYLLSCLESQKPIDLIIISLGTNDLKAKYSATPESIGKGLEECIEAIKIEGKDNQGKIPKVIIMSPAIIIEKERERFGKVEIDFLGANLKSKMLGEIYKNIAEINDFNFINLSKIVTASDIDGIHFDEDQHRKIANVLFKKIKSLI